MEFLSSFSADTLYYVKASLVCAGGLFWVLAYCQSIRVGFSLKTYCIPFVALFLNVGWELYNTIRGFMIAGTYFLNFVNAVWFLLDVIIVYTFWNYGRNEPQKNHQFIWITIGLFFSGLLFNHVSAMLYTPKIGANYFGFVINIIMSILFISNLLLKKKHFTHDLFIAISKLLGTLFLTLLLGVFGVTRLGGVDNAMLLLGMIVFTLDVYYLYRLIKLNYSLSISWNLNKTRQLKD